MIKMVIETNTKTATGKGRYDTHDTTVGSDTGTTRDRERQMRRAKLIEQRDRQR